MLWAHYLEELVAFGTAVKARMLAHAPTKEQAANALECATTFLV